MSFPSVFTNKHILIMTVSRPDDFPKILDHFPKISYTMTVLRFSEDSRSLSEDQL